jgi:uncharacterized RDD family membrane protein YckC
MGSSNIEQSVPTGVYYSVGDLAGLGRRVGILAVDLTILAIVAGFVLALAPETVAAQRAARLAAACFAWAYLAGLKARPNGTLGYRLADVRLVDLQGEPVGLLRSTARFLFLVAGPLNFVFDLLWLTSDPDRQTLRDKLTGTYVVRRGAVATGRGPIVYPQYFIATMAFVLPEVKRQDGTDAFPRH